MQERHLNRFQYFMEQESTTRKYVIPYLQAVMSVNQDSSVLEIGCGEGGNLKPFLDMGCHRVVGVDILEKKILNAMVFFAGHPRSSNIEFYSSDIYKVNDLGRFDIIIMRDVIEHIHGQEKFMELIKKFLNPDGKVFFGFPPWQNPFGGHQQICKSKILSKLPYFHLLPKPAYKFMLKLLGEKDKTIEDLMEIKQTGISIERFERILKKTAYIVNRKTDYFINPNYETKFGLKPREQLRFLSSIPWLRNFYITTCYYIVSEGKPE
jgi:2-polyprenyl-3-methyl-5-hydroxy-6-metoxy-1,4-benzoquinol methylase